ncbi:MAG TPA: hypothetical protein PK152_01420 [Anaerolineales bacterium]|nr:hypothetical protein [Anaerolineales bacterium]HRK87762.1 hypothetical protein [Anaerolineales bacterium]
MKIKRRNTVMFYVSASIAIIGAVGYQYFVKRVPISLNPVVSVMGIYAVMLALCAILLPFFPVEGGLLKHVRQLNWLQLALAVSVFMIELGFLLMYRHGWKLSMGNLVTGAIVNVALVGLGITLLGEKVSAINFIGIALSILGLALIGYRP